MNIIEMVNKIIELSKTGMTISEIVEFTGVHTIIVSSILRN